MRSSTPSASRSADGQPVSRCTCCPGAAALTQARTQGSPSTFSMQFGQSPVRQYSPRRRWYLNDRENTRTPARYSAEATLSPGSTGISRPSKSSASFKVKSKSGALWVVKRVN